MNVAAYVRRSICGNEMAVVLNYSPVRRDGFILEVPAAGDYTVAVNSDLPELGGTGALKETHFLSSVRAEDGKDIITMTLPQLSGIILKRSSEA